MLYHKMMVQQIVHNKLLFLLFIKILKKYLSFNIMNKFYSANYAELDELYDNKSIEAFANNKEGHTKVNEGFGMTMHQIARQAIINKKRERNRKEIMGQLDITYNDNLTTHFNKDDKNENHINHKTIFNHGEVSFVDKTKGINIWNGDGWWTYFNHQGKSENKIRGKTDLKGEVSFVDKDKGVNIHQKKTEHNPSGMGTHFNYEGSGKHYIRGHTYFKDNTEFNGEVNFANKDKGVNIHQKKTKHNPTGMGTHFNLEGSGRHYIRGHTNFRGHVNLHGGRIHVKDKEDKGRVRIGAVWGIPGLYSEDNQDLVLGVTNERKVKLGTKGKFIEVDGEGNLRLPEGAKIFVGNKEIGEHSRHTENSRHTDHAKKQQKTADTLSLSDVSQDSDNQILG